MDSRTAGKKGVKVVGVLGRGKIAAGEASVSRGHEDSGAIDPIDLRGSNVKISLGGRMDKRVKKVPGYGCRTCSEWGYIDLNDFPVFQGAGLAAT